MKKFLLGICCLLALTLGAGQAFAECFLVIKDTPLRNEASAEAKQIDTFKKGMLVKGKELENNPDWCEISEYKPLDNDFLYIHLAYAKDCAGYAYIAAEDLMPVASQQNDYVEVGEDDYSPLANSEGLTPVGTAGLNPSWGKNWLQEAGKYDFSSVFAQAGKAQGFINVTEPFEIQINSVVQDKANPWKYVLSATVTVQGKPVELTGTLSLQKAAVFDYDIENMKNVETGEAARSDISEVENGFISGYLALVDNSKEYFLHGFLTAYFYYTNHDGKIEVHFNDLAEQVKNPYYRNFQFAGGLTKDGDDIEQPCDACIGRPVVNAAAQSPAFIEGTLVDYLKPVTAADIACDGRVDEQALLSALQQWVNDYNYLLATISKKPEDKLVQSLVSNPDKILDTLQGEKIDALEAVAEPVLNTWAYEYDYEAGKLTGADKKIWDLLARYGLGVDTVEGWPFLQVDTVFFRSCFKVSPDAQAMINLLNSQPQKLYVLQSLNYGLESLAKFALEWEDYMVKNPNSPYLAGAAARYKEIVNLLLFCDLPYTPMFSKNNGNKISQEDKDTLRGLVQANTGTFTAKIIEEFLTAVEKNKDKQPKGLKENLASQMDKNFKGAAKKAPATKKLSALEQKIAGKKHMFSLQWIEGGKMGEAVVKQTADGLYIEAKQEHNGDYVVLQGDLTVIDDKTFTVTGDIVTRVSHIADGNVCPRSGTFEFFAKGSRKYWRLQQMTNPCDNVVDYVDVYF